jgi:segregation and condensation protein A
MPYRVKLESFEGPLDLLLFLIKKNEVDIYDIPIAEITKQYLEYLELIKILDLEMAGDFILLAATLIHIKSQMLLPKPQLDEDEEEVIDPRLELVTKLLEYKRFKEMAFKLRDFEDQQIDYFPRLYFYDQGEEVEEEQFDTSDISLFSLIQAFKQVIDNIPKESFHQVKDIQVNTEQQIQFILNYLEEKKQISFIDLISQLRERIIIIVTFIALLELIKRHQIIVKQAIPFGEIWIKKN